MQDLAATTQMAPKANQPKPIEDYHIDDLLRLTVESGASDLHLAVGIPPVIRVDGELKTTNFTKLTAQDTQRLCYDIVTDEQMQRFEAALELDYSYSIAKLSRFRVNLFKDKGTVAAAFRVIPQRIPTL